METIKKRLDVTTETALSKFAELDARNKEFFDNMALLSSNIVLAKEGNKEALEFLENLNKPSRGRRKELFTDEAKTTKTRLARTKSTNQEVQPLQDITEEMNKDTEPKLALKTIPVVKLERLTQYEIDKAIAPPATIKSEAFTENMPPPVGRPKRKCVKKSKLLEIKEESMTTGLRSTRSKARLAAKATDKAGRESDVIVQVGRVTTINLDADEDSTAQRSTRSNALKANDDHEKKRQASPKESTRTKKSKSSDSVYEDAVETIPAAGKNNEPSDATFVAAAAASDPSEATFVAASAPPADATFVAEPAKSDKTIVLGKKKSAHDDGNATYVAEPAKPDRTVIVNKETKKTKEVDELMTDDESDEGLEMSPVKQKVKAFEKWANSGTPQSKTTSKGVGTPLSKIPLNKYGSATKKGLRLTPNSAKTLSALKATHLEAKEREQRRKEREAELARMKEAALEEKKRKRELKEVKARQQREELELERLRRLDQQHQLDMEKRQRLKEEMDRKRRQQMEERAVRAKHQQANSAATVKVQTVNGEPIFKTCKAPLLPTYDCRDSDEEGTDAPKIPRPGWMHRDDVILSGVVTSTVTSRLRNGLFSSGVQTCDLLELFVNVEPKHLRRNSSAIWHVAPRYTTMFDRIVQ